MRAFPFDSRIVGYDADGLPNYDRASNSEEFARLLASFLSDGVFGSGMCAVLEDTGMTASVQPGACLIQGRYGYIITPETVTFDVADAAPRIDTVVLQRHLGADVRNIRTAVHKGVAAASPSAPALTRDNTVWELGLANILIPANSTAIAQSRITDTRLNTDRCGIVASIMGEVDTSALYAQIQADMAGFKANEQAAFSAWFAGLQTDLSGDVAGNLLNKINVLETDVAKKVQCVLYYTNASPTSEFGAWKPGMNLDGYTSVLIEYFVNAATLGYRPRLLVPIGGEALAVGLMNTGRQASRHVTAASDGVVFGDCYLRDYNTAGAGTVNNTYMVPYRIWAVKGV